MKLLSVLVIFHICLAVNTSRVQNAKSQIQDEVRHAIGRPPRPPSRKEIAEIRHDIGHHHNLDQPRKWSHRRRLGTYFTPWTRWSECDPLCRQSRERYCRYRRKCGETKQSEERKCSRCHPKSPVIEDIPPKHHFIQSSSAVKIPVYEEIPKFPDQSDYYIVRKYKKKRKPMVIEIEDYEDLEKEEDEDDETDIYTKQFDRRQVKSVRSKSFNASHLTFGPDVEKAFDSAIRKGRKALPHDASFEYEEATDVKDWTAPDNFDMEYDDYDEVKNSTRISHREKAVFELPPRHSRIYTRWSKWSKCSPKCTTRRYKRCRMRQYCDEYVLREIAYCYTEGSFCQGWVESQVHKTPDYAVKPMATSRQDTVHSNAIVNDFMLSGKGYRGPEYRPLKLKSCGISNVRASRRNSIQNMLKIIGGKTARRGQWPWQVVIFNRFKEAFCGGTLIAPNWVLTAAHCVRKVLYVRIGEHNLDIKDDSEIEMRVIKAIKHPNYDKTTVDSDVALLKLPKAINPTQWIGYACMPTPYQSLPKNIQCTVIGWGKRRNRDQAGTSVLNQAEVPIISMESCKAVYHDYTITKNMFCAGHKRGRIDTCAGDSGGPLLCRDVTQPNHPWTIFGITSFGDGCAKKNKFGIYAKVPNYVDWVWSVVNCNGNCKGRKLA